MSIKYLLSYFLLQNYGSSGDFQEYTEWQLVTEKMTPGETGDIEKTPRDFNEAATQYSLVD